jgi:hypothetical protein
MPQPTQKPVQNIHLNNLLKKSIFDKRFLGFKNITDSTKNDVIPYATQIKRNNFILF